ncbi:MAG: SIS domain-containing protein [Acidimicrobiales bacterium]|jgi:glucosamine--fructose-6-phosphate aminotransferase (isomerizing)
MCGIIAVVRRTAERTPPSAAELTELLDPVPALIEAAPPGGLARAVEQAAERVAEADRLLRGVPGVVALVRDRGLLSHLDLIMSGLSAQIEAIEAALDEGEASGRSPADIEALSAGLVRLKDACWAVQRDRLRTARAVDDLAGPDAPLSALAVYTSIQQSLSALDRLEVRGRDSAGLHVLVRGHGLDLSSPALRAVIEERTGDRLFTSGAIRVAGEHIGFVYKAAAEIGELGDNTRALREAVRADDLLRLAISAPTAEAVVLGHTRWASVGIISQPNAHPLSSDEVGIEGGPYVTAVLNGDVDNFADLKAVDGLHIAPEITTDAKVIPTLVSRQLAAGVDPVEAFRSTVNRLEGSVAIAAQLAVAPADLLLALRGSGQALYVGLAEDAFVVASEPYGVVEETDTYLRMDGETPADPENPGSRGQIIRLHGALAGSIEGIERWSYDGRPRPVDPSELAVAQITTRDIDRGDFPHYLLKEISESPSSFRKTLRGRLIEVGDGDEAQLTVQLSNEALPPEVRRKLRDGVIRRVFVIGQGTAAGAGHSLAAALAVVAPDAPLQVSALLATELSGFDLRQDMSDTLVVAISQSGTTTDTNRTVDLVRARGASVIAIVNRRNSDLTDKADGVLYTSDGRDVEMSVASTKAFYSQIAACFLLAVAIADELGLPPQPDRQELLRSLRGLPEAMERTLQLRPSIALAAQQLAPSRRYWAIVGNGVNRIAAYEVRIKLSELCYKSIACDATEDKKHIDLSSEPLILVCAAGLNGSTADDVAKEVAIFRAHKAAPVVIASEGDERFSAALHAIPVPQTHPGLAFVLSAMAGHLFGYEAALAIDAQARPLREARAAIETTLSSPGTDPATLLERIAPAIEPLANRFFDALRAGDYDGHLEVSTGVRLASLFRFALGMVPLEVYQAEYGKIGTPSVVVEDLLGALSRAIEELTRPIDAIKHQAKTVTVGISRSDETLLQVPLVRSVLEAGAPRDRLSYSSLRTLAALEPLVDEVLGYTRYSITGRVDEGDDTATIVVVDRGGLGRELRSRTDDNPALRGTKRRVATERMVLLARGRSDGRTVILVPEVKGNQTTGLTLLHVRLAESLPLPTVRALLQGYRGRYQALRDAVTETEPTFRDDLLADIPLVELMTDPIYDLAERWRS